MKSLALATFLLFANTSLANKQMPSGYELGNGGFFAVCSEQSIVGAGVFSVDRLEGSSLYQLKPAKTFTEMDNEDQIVETIIDSLAKVNPTRGALYRQWFQEIRSSREFIENSFFPLPDSGVTVIPENCKQEQGAIFVTVPFDAGKIRFLFNKNLWMKASALDRAYLLMHELIYREAVLPENQHLNSSSARYFNAWLFQNAEVMNQFDIIDLMSNLKFMNVDYNGISIMLLTRYSMDPTRIRMAPLERYPGTKNIKKAPLSSSFSIPVGDEVFNYVCNLGLNSLYGEFYGYAEFYESGRVKKMHFVDYDLGPQKGTPGYFTTNCSFHGNNYLEFDENGVLTKAEQVRMENGF